MLVKCANFIMNMNANGIFHVHTYRCGHAQMISESVYIEKAAALDSPEIWFSDHAPFPGNPFGNRMRHEELNEYLETLISLRDKYKNTIRVRIGLEIEYIQSYDEGGYYKALKNDKRIEFLLLGQHMAEVPDVPGMYTFSWDKEHLASEDYAILGNAEAAGIKTGYFDAVAHPDRIYRRCKEWDSAMAETAHSIIEEARKRDIPLEINMHSIKCKHHYWKQFWDIAKEAGVQAVIGLDAHSISEIERRYARQKQWMSHM